MVPFTRKRWFNVLRITACAVALVIVVQGVTLHDHITLKDSTQDLVGTVSVFDGRYVIDLVADGRRTVDVSEIAVDERGDPRVSYGLRTAWRISAKSLLLLALAIQFTVVFPQALRFRLMLKAQAIHLGYWECLKLTFAGNFLNFATPLGSNLGDVFKAYFVSQHTSRKTEAATTVVLDRIVGLIGLLLVVTIITGLSRSDSRLAEVRPYMLGMFGFCLLVGFAYFSQTIRRLLVPRALIARLPKKDQFQRIDNAGRTLAAHKSIVASGVLLTILLQGVAIGGYFVVAIALALRANAGNVLEYYTYFYTGVLVQALPGPPQGLGTVELTYRYFLAPFGSPSQIVCVAFAIRVIVLVSALPGLLVTLTGAYRPRDLAGLEPSVGSPDNEPGDQARQPANI